MLRTLHREMKGPFTAGETAEALSLDIKRAQRFLAYLADRGWLARLRRGLYITVPLDALHPAEWREDPWVVAAKIFAPFYIGGWSACEHWHLTEQIFHETVVISGRRLRHGRLEIQGFTFWVKRVTKDKIFGTSTVWRGQTKVQVSDPARTTIDILANPGIGGGMRHVAEILNTYMASDVRDESKLLEYARRIGNRAVFKRLGYLLETLGVLAPNVIDVCAKEKSSGVALLDPTVPRKGQILRRWNLQINVAGIMES